MIDNITVRYEKEGVNVTLSVDYDDGLPYNLAELFRRIIEDTDVNPEILFEQLADDNQMIKIERE